MDKEYEILRAELWAKVWGVTAAANCLRASTCTQYADEFLHEFDARFKAKFKEGNTK
jgi:hypothetical protein